MGKLLMTFVPGNGELTFRHSNSVSFKFAGFLLLIFSRHKGERRDRYGDLRKLVNVASH